MIGEDAENYKAVAAPKASDGSFAREARFVMFSIKVDSSIVVGC